MYVCLGVILVCVLVLFWLKKNFGSALIVLGWSTLIPGFAAIVLGMVGEQKLLMFVEKVSPLVIPYVQDYIITNVPSYWFITAGYLFIGYALYAWGCKLTSRKTMLAQAKKLFPGLR